MNDFALAPIYTNWFDYDGIHVAEIDICEILVCTGANIAYELGNGILIYDDLID